MGIIVLELNTFLFIKALDDLIYLYAMLPVTYVG